MQSALNLNSKPGQVSERNPQTTIEALSTVLADTYTLALKTQNFHWNVEGPHFFSLHQLFEAQYTELHSSIDEIAERIRALGARSPGSLQTFSEMSTIDEAPKTRITANEMVHLLQRDHTQLAERFRALAANASLEGDTPSAGLLDARTAFHEKAAWMLKATGL
jgi:starvation-inducible DNA-binding protein